MPTNDQARFNQAHLATPDADNLAKLALDCFQRTGLLANDSAVWRLEVSKTWVSPGLAGMSARLDQEAPGGDQGLAWPDWLSR
jgi:Holliday junction resolvase RusA-like endonuclease